MKIRCECTYCGHIWIRQVYYNIKSIEELNLMCDKAGCNDKNIKAVPIENLDIFGYNWIPPEKKEYFD